MDHDTRAVYATEQQLRDVMDQMDATDVRTLDFFGSKLELPIVRRFADIPSIQRYCDLVCEAEGLPSVTVHHTNATTKAYYTSTARTIHIPDERWSRSEIVVLHELAHHGAPMSNHGKPFQAAFISLVRKYIGPEVALVLEAGFHMNTPAA